MAQIIPIAESLVDDGDTVAGNIDANFTELYGRMDAEEGKTAVTHRVFTPQPTQPTADVEGLFFYDQPSGTMKVQGPFDGVQISVGHGEHTHIINESGALIAKGSPVRHNGVNLNGKVKVELAQADTFDNARIYGVAQHDIAHNTEGAIATSGEIEGLNTSAFTAGVPIYLSDTVAGGWTETAPAIISRIGGVKISDAVDGVFQVALINNRTLPKIFGGMQGQTAGNETYSLTAVVQDIINYETEVTVVINVDPLTGVITLSNTGEYRVHATASISFASTTSTRTIYVELYDITNDEIHFTYTKNIPRDATEDALGFSWPIDELAGNQHKLRIRASDNFDVTFTDISLDIESVSIV